MTTHLLYTAQELDRIRWRSAVSKHARVCGCEECLGECLSCRWKGEFQWSGSLLSVAPDLCAIDVFSATERAAFQGFTSEGA